MTRVAFDSNILIYFAGIAHVESDEDKVVKVRNLFRALERVATLVMPVQALGELAVVMRRHGVPMVQARTLIAEFGEGALTPASDAVAMLAALDLVVQHRLQYWDALILSAAANAGCVLLLSEDMQDGFVSRGVTVVNPLAPDPHAKLAAMLAEAS